MAIEVGIEVATGLSETNDAFAARLQAIFADEARTHLEMVRAGLAALAENARNAQSVQSAQSADSAAAVDPASNQAGEIRGLHQRLHTLKGAAHAVGMDELELLCHALETAIGALAAGGRFAAAPLAQLQAAVELAGLLLASPAGRSRGQALAMAGQLEALRGLAPEAPLPPPTSCPAA